MPGCDRIIDRMDEYDLIVVGAGHAGCEAALAGVGLGENVILLTINLDTIAQMSCNPAIGGLAKGQLVREVDALGGEMAHVIDRDLWAKDDELWRLTVQDGTRLQPIPVGIKQFQDDDSSVVIEMARREGVEIKRNWGQSPYFFE